LRHMRATVSAPVDVTCTAQAPLLMIVAEMRAAPKRGLHVRAHLKNRLNRIDVGRTAFDLH
jgi:hypothetical protein